MKKEKFKIVYTISSRNDMRKMKKYIMDAFKYREFGENFTKKMKEATEGLKMLPAGFDTVGLQYRGYDIHLKPFGAYLFFYIVDDEKKTVTVLRVMQDGMDWQFKLKQWLKDDKFCRK